MNTADRCESGRETVTRLDLLLSEDERRTDHAAKCLSFSTGRDEIDQPAPPKRFTINQHADFRQSLAKPRPLDEIDELVEELRAREFEEKGARR